MESYSFWETKGLALGLSGENMLAFITSKETEALQREERLEKHSKEKEERELQKLKLEREGELQKLKLEREGELQKLKLEREEATKKREYELALATLQANSSNNSSPAPLTVTIDQTRPLPYKEGDDITAYIDRFERIATMLKWEKADWAVRLGSLLQGKALGIFTSLDNTVTADYDELKKALLKGLKKTTDQYRRDFRNARISPDFT